LYIFQFYYPNLQNTNTKTLARIYTNKLISKFKEYTKIHKYLTTYGPGFVEKYVRKDGTIAPSGVNQILNTGRVAFGILLQMPGQARFRNAFLPPEDDWVFVDSDYASAEVAIMAYAAGEDAFLKAIKEGKDLHMMSASLIFADKWKELAEPGCTHIVDGSKCDCVEHNKLRKQSKAITFGLAYGLSYVGLAERLDITRTEAQALMDKFFSTFSHLEKFFNDNAESGIKNNYIVGLPPTKRIRFFHTPVNEGERSAIGRQSKNYPIQEANASMLKIALVLMRNYIRDYKFPARLHLPVHEETLSSCPRNKAEEWKEVQEKCMIDAADMFLEKGLLGVDTEILDRWTK
jgi:DNA polymerase-1